MAGSNFFLGLLLLSALVYQRYTEKIKFVTTSGRGLTMRPLQVGKWRYGVALLCVAGLAIGLESSRL